MILTAGLVLLLILALVQTTLLPWQLAFAAVVLYHFFIEELPNLNWLLVVSLLVALLGNLNPGTVIIALTLAFLILETAGKVLPSNRLTKSLLVVLAIPLAEVSLVFVSFLWH